eukprot:scaffold30333_cov19-Prasinocladus_malaysianus.AAC.2
MNCEETPLLQLTPFTKYGTSIRAKKWFNKIYYGQTLYVTQNGIGSTVLGKQMRYSHEVQQFLVKYSHFESYCLGLSLRPRDAN